MHYLHQTFFTRCNAMQQYVLCVRADLTQSDRFQADTKYKSRLPQHLPSMQQ